MAEVEKSVSEEEEGKKEEKERILWRALFCLCSKLQKEGVNDSGQRSCVCVCEITYLIYLSECVYK